MGKARRMKMNLKELSAERQDEIVASVRAKHLDRWMERMAEIGRPVSDPSEIDYTD